MAYSKSSPKIQLKTQGPEEEQLFRNTQDPPLIPGEEPSFQGYFKYGFEGSQTLATALVLAE